MRDIELYGRWWSTMTADDKPSVALEEWLRSGLLKVTLPKANATTAPFYPFVGYVNTAEDVLYLINDLRALALQRSADEATALRLAVAKVIGQWEFENAEHLTAIRLSFRLGALFACEEICDELASRTDRLIDSPSGVITGLADMACGLREPGRKLLVMLLAKCVESMKEELLFYLLTRAIEASATADCNIQRDLVFDLMCRYVKKLNFRALDALEALSDVFIDRLRLSEMPLSSAHIERFWDLHDQLDDDVLLEALAEFPTLRTSLKVGIGLQYKTVVSQASSSPFEQELMAA